MSQIAELERVRKIYKFTLLTTVMLSDKETDIDALGFEPYTNSLSELITEKGITPFTIGIFGSWGMGKTSLMLMLKKKLESNDNVRTVWFNAWKFDDEKQIWAALIQAVLNQLAVSLGENARLKLHELRNSIEWIQFLEFVGKSILSRGPDIDALKSSFKFGKKVESISEFEKKFEGFVDSCNIERLVIFIDDLDRCKKRATVDILEAIKLLLNSKKCVYVLGLDYERVCDAVSRKFVGISEDVAKDYLDKIIQLAFHIPRRSEEDMKLYLRYLFALEFLEKENLQVFTADMRKIQKNIDTGFLKLLKTATDTFSMDKYKALTEHDLLIIRENGFNPRKLKRFLNIYEMRRSLSDVLQLNLENEYLIKFLLLQTKFSNFYRDLENYPGLLRQIKDVISLTEEERKERLAKSELLKKYYADNELLRFVRDVPFEDVDPRPYLRIAQTAESEIILGEKEKIILEDLMSDDAVKIGEGLKNFQELDEEQEVTIVRDLLEGAEQVDAQVRRKSLQAFGTLREAIPNPLMAAVVRKLIEKTKDEDADVRNQAKWTYEGLREVIPEGILQP
jgi:hypothetical protein